MISCPILLAAGDQEPCQRGEPHPVTRLITHPVAGLREMQRVARRVVVFTFDGTEAGWLRRFWLTRDYLPEAAGVLARRQSLSQLAGQVGGSTEPALIPWDCADGFFEAHWRRPEAYLQEDVRRGHSIWTKVGSQAEERAVRSPTT